MRSQTEMSPLIDHFHSAVWWSSCVIPGCQRCSVKSAAAGIRGHRCKQMQAEEGWSRRKHKHTAALMSASQVHTNFTLIISNRAIEVMSPLPWLHRFDACGASAAKSTNKDWFYSSILSACVRNQVLSSQNTPAGRCTLINAAKKSHFLSSAMERLSSGCHQPASVTRVGWGGQQTVLSLTVQECWRLTLIF